MKIIELRATSEKIHIKQNYVVYQTDTEAAPGLIVMADDSAEKGLILVDQVHLGGPVVLKFKPFTTPARKYEIGSIAAKLIVFE